MVFQRTQDLIPAPTQQLATIFYSSSTVSIAFVCPLWALYAVAHIQADKIPMLTKIDKVIKNMSYE